MARRKLRLLHSAEILRDLRVPPSNHLEILEGELLGYYSIRVDDRWRIFFQWIKNDAYNVRIIDYHYYEKAPEHTSG